MSRRELDEETLAALFAAGVRSMTVYFKSPSFETGQGWLTSVDDVIFYMTDPERFAASFYGFTCINDYREWVETDGIPRCGGATKRGTLCSNAVPGYGSGCLKVDDWIKLHRTGRCSKHRDEPR